MQYHREPTHQKYCEYFRANNISDSNKQYILHNWLIEVIDLGRYSDKYSTSFLSTNIHTTAVFLSKKLKNLYSVLATLDYVYLKTKYLMAYFEGARRGEMRELQEALNSRSLDDKKNALKKVIAQMTVGKDLSDLFQPVIKCLEFNDLEMKKLVCI
jgi:hypothetical protein